MSAGYNTPQSDHTTLDVYRGSVLHFTADPLHHPEGTAWHEDGLLLIRDANRGTRDGDAGRRAAPVRGKQ